jgi:hypothetical protein
MVHMVTGRGTLVMLLFNQLLQADSGADPQLYHQLAQAPVVLVDARAKSSTEHASFDEVEAAGGVVVVVVMTDPVQLDRTCCAQTWAALVTPSTRGSQLLHTGLCQPRAVWFLAHILLDGKIPDYTGMLPGA